MLKPGLGYFLSVFTISASISLQSVPTAAVRLASVAEHSYLCLEVAFQTNVGAVCFRWLTM